MSIANQNRRREAPILISDSILHLFIQIIRLPKTIQGTRLLLIKPNPRFPFPTPMKQTHRTRVQRPTHPIKIIPTKPMLVPPMINRFNVPTKHKQKGWQRTQFINPLLPLQLHPVLNFPPVVPLPPLRQIHHHHPGVEIARLARAEHARE